IAESKAFGVPTRLGGNALKKTVRSYTASLLTILSEKSPESSQGLFFLLLLVLGRFLVFFLASAGVAAGAAGGPIIIELADFRASSILTSDNAATRALTWASSACPPAAETIFLTFSSFTGCAHE